MNFVKKWKEKKKLEGLRAKGRRDAYKVIHTRELNKARASAVRKQAINDARAQAKAERVAPGRSGFQSFMGKVQKGARGMGGNNLLADSSKGKKVRKNILDW